MWVAGHREAASRHQSDRFVLEDQLVAEGALAHPSHDQRYVGRLITAAYGGSRADLCL
jgi:hypothetical protein